MHELILLYREYKKEFGYRDRLFVALHNYYGIRERSEYDDEDVI